MPEAERLQLPNRPGLRPVTTHPTNDRPFPHKQVSQIAPPELQEALFERASELPGVVVGDSLVSVPGARAFHLQPETARGPRDAFQRGREFAHIHPPDDGSLHLTLPPAVYEEVLGKGWGEPHPISGTMMLFGPRDEAELELVWQILLESYRFATGATGSGNR